MTKEQVLKQYFGYDTFREGQEELIGRILEGGDVLGIMPTGSGKSLCFQVPALMLKGITLVISPLISLMKDQVAGLNQAGIHAAYLNSSLTYSQYCKALQYAKEGRYPIIYVAPERLLTEEFLEFALSVEISMIAVDEAHCVSQWGQDFRPSYLKITEFVNKLPKRPIVSAFTATATRQVREDVIAILGLQEPLLVTTGYDRPNLYLEVQAPADKYAVLRKYVECHSEQFGIVYCSTRKLVDEVCERLVRDGFSATRYHAGLNDEERRENQDLFLYDRRMIMVATNAFGMGIDKSNVRYVVHYNMPKNPESYYQEVGRCSRDGEPGECLLLYSGQDVITNTFLIENSQDNEELDEASRKTVMERDRERLRKMTYYCTTHDCLRGYLLKYFGEYGTNYCGNCANCRSHFETVDVTDMAKAIIGCVSASRERFGITVILDTVHGGDTAKIRKYHMDTNIYYGSLSEVPVYTLRAVLNHLLMEGYLQVTEDGYSVLKLTEQARAVSAGKIRIEMKLSKGTDWKQGAKTTRKNGAARGSAGERSSLFNRLRALRTQIAREEGIPPYIVFSDKTLEHMSAMRPADKSEMLKISGVGSYKYEKYGERFLAVIQDKI